MPRGVPRSRESPDDNVIDINLSELMNHMSQKNLPVSGKLSLDYYRLKKKLNEEIDVCPICLESVDCPRCFTLLPCSHHLCGHCYIRLTGDKSCPLCRAV